MKAFIGIDPGASGGIAAIDGTGDYVAEKMPKTLRDTLEVLTLMKQLGDQPYAVIEKVGSMPGQGVASTFKFGYNAGALEMALLAAEIPFVFAAPLKWQRAMQVKRGKTKTEHKNNMKAQAQRLFPRLNVTLATADALLLAAYARQHWTKEMGV